MTTQLTLDDAPTIPGHQQTYAEWLSSVPDATIEALWAGSEDLVPQGVQEELRRMWLWERDNL